MPLSPGTHVVLLALVCLQIANTYVQRYGHLRAWDMAVPPFVCVATALALALRRRYVLAVVPLLFAQHVYYGGFYLFPQMLIHGRLSFVPCIPRPHSEVKVVVASAGNKDRIAHMNRELARAGWDFDLRIFDFHNVNLDVGARHCIAMRTILEEYRSTPWLLILEDDAVLHWGFRWQLACALTAEKDITFLDSRSAIMRNLLGTYEGSTAGMLFRTSASPRVVEHMCAGKPLYDEVVRTIGHGRNVTADCIFAAVCNKRMLTCQTWPLVSERGFATTSLAPAVTVVVAASSSSSSSP